MSTTTKEPHTNGEAETITIPKIGINTIKVPIVGMSLLCTHRWTEKAKKQMRDKQQGNASEGQEDKDPEYNARASAYILERDKREAWNNGEIAKEALTFGVRAVAFREAMIRGYKNADLGPMTDARSSFFVTGEDDQELVTLEHPPEYPKMREDMVTVGRGTADIRYRPYWPEWSATLVIEFQKNMISVEQVLQCVQHAGYGVGINERRPQKGGQWGRFKIREGEKANILNG